MVQLLKKTQVITKDGECQVNITLDLNIKIDSSGVAVSAAQSNQQRAIKEDDDQINWDAAVPDFKPKKKGLMKFGKKDKE